MRALIIALAMASPALAQSPQCAGYTDVAEGLYRNFGEELATRGLTQDGSVIETWANPDTGTWTIVGVTPDMVACLLLSGGNFEAHRPKPET